MEFRRRNGQPVRRESRLVLQASEGSTCTFQLRNDSIELRDDALLMAASALEPELIGGAGLGDRAVRDRSQFRSDSPRYVLDHACRPFCPRERGSEFAC